MLGFGAVALVAVAVGLSLLALHEMWRRERVVVIEETVADLVDSVAAIRRTEKNYFLYGDRAELEANVAAVARVEVLLAQQSVALADRGAPELPRGLASILASYRTRMAAYAAQPDDAAEQEVRNEGKELSAQAQVLAERRRDGVHDAMRGERTLVLGMVGGSLALVLAVGVLLAVKVARPLKAMQDRLEEVATGRLGRLDLPAGDAEVRSLARAFNRVFGELELRQQQMLVAQKLASLGVMLSGVAHELNNPLSNISSTAQILLEEGDGVDRAFLRDGLCQIDDQTERARRIVAALLDCSRHHAFMREPCALQDLVAQTVGFVRGQVPGGVAIEVDVPAGLQVSADRQRLQQALLNLIKNAAEACGGAGAVRVSAAKDDEAVTLTVEDSGCGIPETDLPYVFDPFYTTKEIGKGSGLGLFIVHDIVGKHGGTISVTSAPGCGTSFVIHLPQRAVSPAPAAG